MKPLSIESDGVCDLQKFVMERGGISDWEYFKGGEKSRKNMSSLDRIFETGKVNTIISQRTDGWLDR